MSVNEQGMCLVADLMARHLNVASPVSSPPMNMEETNLGECTLKEVGVQHDYQWPNEDWNAIQEYKSWLNEEWERVEKLEFTGPTGEPWPKKPTQDIKRLDHGKRNNAKPNVLYGQELREYLMKNCVDSIEVMWPKYPAGGYSSLDKMKPFLIAGHELLRQHHKGILAWSVHYGSQLNFAIAQHKHGKCAGKIDIKWEKWLLDSIGISPSYGRKLHYCRSAGTIPRIQKAGSFIC
jgi:hypothetical protein